jgi:hypothetical protein
LIFQLIPVAFLKMSDQFVIFTLCKTQNSASNASQMDFFFTGSSSTQHRVNQYSPGIPLGESMDGTRESLIKLALAILDDDRVCCDALVWNLEAMITMGL